MRQSSDGTASWRLGGPGLPAAVMREPRIGDLVAGSQYRILGRLGSGGFGTVYLVETLIGGLRRALKVLHSDKASDPARRERFVREAVTLERLNHPNITRCYAAGVLEPGGEPYLLLELVEGTTLAALLHPPHSEQPRPLSPLRAVRIAKQIASGLVVAHASGVIHRDLKPANVLVTDAGTIDEQVKIVDFGIARALDSSQTTSISLVGTPLFMAPEQLESGLSLDARVDIWQLGAVLFLMLTGRAPYGATSIGELLREFHKSGDLGPFPGSIEPQLAAVPALDRLVAQMLAPVRDRRPRSAAHLCAELARIEQSLSSVESVDGALALLEALCARPSADAWSALCRYVSTLPPCPESLVAAAEALLAAWPDHLRVAPVGWWEMARRGEHCPTWPLVRALDLSDRGMNDDDAREIAGVAALRPVTVLDLSGNEIGNDGAAALADSANLASLKQLDLSRNRLSSAGVRALTESPHLTHILALKLAGNGLGLQAAQALASTAMPLCELDLSDNALQSAGAQALAQSPALSNLVTLELRDNGLGADGISALAMSRTLVNLAVLNVSHNGIGPAGAATLALSPNVARLRTLGLAGNQLGLHGLELLLSSNRFSALETLDLSSNDVGAQGAMLLAASSFARRLKALHVANNGLGDAGLAALLGAPHLAGLRQLEVAQNGLTTAGLRLIANAPPELEALDVSGNEMDDSASAFESMLPRLRLRSLKVASCGLSASDLAAVLSNAPSTLERLDASGNKVDAEAAGTLSKVTTAGSLRWLDLSRNAFRAAGVKALVQTPALKHVRTLWLCGAGLEDTDAIALATSLGALPELEELRLDDNDLGPSLAAALAGSPFAARLVHLSLASARLGDAGIAALARGRSWHALRWLDILRNDVSLGAAATVLASPALALASHVGLAQNAIAGVVDVHSLADRQVALLEASLARVIACRADFAERFYAHVFSRYPGVRPLFARTNMRQQQQHLTSTLALVIDHMRNPDLAAEQLRALGARHAGYGVFPSHYHAITDALLDTLREVLGTEWNDDIGSAWHDGLQAIARTMTAAH